MYIFLYVYVRMYIIYMYTDRPGQRQVRGIVESNLIRLFRLQFSWVEASSSIKIVDFHRKSCL